jgi:hypothetical protein
MHAEMLHITYVHTYLQKQNENSKKYFQKKKRFYILDLVIL